MQRADSWYNAFNLMQSFSVPEVLELPTGCPLSVSCQVHTLSNHVWPTAENSNHAGTWSSSLPSAAAGLAGLHVECGLFGRIEKVVPIELVVENLGLHHRVLAVCSLSWHGQIPLDMLDCHAQGFMGVRKGGVILCLSSCVCCHWGRCSLICATCNWVPWHLQVAHFRVIVGFVHASGTQNW